jgi:hypothetical protein
VRQPVRFLVRARALALELEIERAVRLGLERHPVRDGEAVDRIRNLEALRVIKGDRPERVSRRRGTVVESDGVLAGAVERLAGLVSEIERFRG